ncbi:ADP-ribosylglycohydrolase family protein [Streptomyces sp. CT34]|uniref:ADP-ribosylglycohydrolase family protein n=1 Tax=Streptomyces sp. CT34 TaxID=1553907 RepID=UPI000A4D0F7B|nr:ADP-ribosylglycohydrolase family protein [Streptomyces sp. CT34]
MTDGGAGAAGPIGSGPGLRITWVQPEDLLGHELRQAAEDGRDAAGIARRWRAAGGAPAPARAGASPGPADPALRALAGRLLDELALLPCPSAADEPTDLDAITALCPQLSGPAEELPPEMPPDPPDPPELADLTDRLEAAWLGRAAGCLLGKPVEKLPLAGIREIARSTGNWPLASWFTGKGLDPAVAARYPWNRRSRATSLAENIDGMPEDDDLDHPLLGLLLLERHGPGFGTADVARLWLDELPAGRTFTAERVAYRNLLDGIEPPATARHRNPFREWIGARIRADVHGWTRPGDPAGAAAQVWRDATLSHTANGVYDAMFVAAALAAAGGGSDVHGALRAGLAVIPPGSRLAAAVRCGIAAAHDEPTGGAAGFAAVVDRLHDAYGHHHWVHAVPNAALLAAALTHADGDFTGSICRAVSGGWDTDSNGATAGSLAGLLAGSPAALPAHWTAPLRNRLATAVGGQAGIGFDTLARRTAALAVRHRVPRHSRGPARPRSPRHAHRPKAPAP